MKRAFSRKFNPKRRRPASARRNRLNRSIQIESLEDRRVLAVTAALTGGVLSIVGDAESNHIEISQTP